MDIYTFFYEEEIIMNKKKRRKIAKTVAILFRVIGTLILLTVIGVTASIVIPQMRGYEVDHVVSGSMEPNIPVGSAVYVNKKIKPVDIEEKDIIAFKSGSSLVVHRVLQNQKVDEIFRTKGDANEGEDLHEVPYRDYEGKVVKHVPYIGQIIMIFTTGLGKISVLCFAACGLMLNILAGRLSEGNRRNAS